MVLSIIFILSSLIHVSFQCFGLGCFGVGGCGTSCLFGLCLQAPIIQPIGCPCGSSFMCLRGACVSRAAAGTKIFKDDVQADDDKGVTTHEDHFMMCCSLLDVPSDCSHMCSYDNYTMNEVESALRTANNCSVTELKKIHFCAAHGEDHTDCCRKSFVPEDCQNICDQSSNTMETFTDVRTLQCPLYFNEIKACFQNYAISDYFRNIHNAKTWKNVV